MKSSGILNALGTWVDELSLSRSSILEIYLEEFDMIFTSSLSVERTKGCLILFWAKREMR